MARVSTQAFSWALGFSAALACAASFNASAEISQADSRIYSLFVNGRALRVGCAMEQPGFDAKFSRVFDPWTQRHKASIAAAQAELERVNARPSAEVESEIVHKIADSVGRASPSERQEACTSIIDAISKSD